MNVGTDSAGVPSQTFHLQLEDTDISYTHTLHEVTCIHNTTPNRAHMYGRERRMRGQARKTDTLAASRGRGRKHEVSLERIEWPVLWHVTGLCSPSMSLTMLNVKVSGIKNYCP